MHIHKKPYAPKILVAAMALLMHQLPAWAVDPFVLKDIRVEGLQRADAGAVFAALPFRVGDTYTDDKGSTALRSLFATGLFTDVKLDVKGDVVTVIVQERPVIAHVDFVGTKEFDKDVLVKALKDVGIGEGQPFDRAQADRAEQELKRQYLTRSLYGAEIVTTITPIERNRVNVTFTVSEGQVARIRSIHIIGNHVFSESTLLEQMDLTTGGWLTWYSKSDQYSRTKLNADLESVKSYYLNRGYLECNITSTQVAISPDKKDISITINIDEGQRYIVTAVRLEGDFLGKEAAFESLITMKAGEPYRAEDVASTTRMMTDRFAAFGYAFARIEFRPEIDRKNGQVVAVFSATPQKRVYVRRINIAGNSRTRDEVIRREFRQYESSWYDGQKIRLSRDRVDRLGYFKTVSIDTKEVPGTQDQVDLTINVEERPTGNLSLGVGFSTLDKVSLSAGVKQDNIFGTGNSLGVQFNTSRINRTYVVSTTDPYFTDDGISRSIDLYYKTSQPLLTQTGLSTAYKIVTPGVSLRFGVPFTEKDTVFFGVGAEHTQIQGTDLPNNYFLYEQEYGSGSTSYPLTIGWARDSRDSALVPNKGTYNRLNVELGAFGDTRYVRSDYQFQQYLELTPRYTLAFNAEGGYGRGLEGYSFPIFKNFYGGGQGTVRGFADNSLGPVDVTGAYLGGNRRVNINTELYVPVPGSGNDRTLRLFGFVDAGNVWGVGEAATLDSMRVSAGIGLSWVSPVGPLKLSYAQPVHDFSQDKIERFQFQIGTAF